MSWKKMSDDERRSAHARAAQRGMSMDTPSADDDVIVDRGGLELRPGMSRFKPTVMKPKSFDEVIAAIGPSERERKAAETSREHLNHRDQLLRFAFAREPQRAEGAERARMANIAFKAALRGVLSPGDVKGLGLSTLIDKLVGQIDIWQWLFPTIVVKSGSTLTFSGSATSVHSLVAHKLVIEPNARVVINRVPVSIDCTHLEVQ